MNLAFASRMLSVSLCETLQSIEQLSDNEVEVPPCEGSANQHSGKIGSISGCLWSQSLASFSPFQTKHCPKPIWRQMTQGQRSDRRNTLVAHRFGRALLLTRKDKHASDRACFCV
jgi:hypothetical protein